MFATRAGWPLSPNRLSELLRERRERGLPHFDLTESNPTRCGFEIDREAILASLRDPRAIDYDPDPRGLLVAREAVAQYYSERGVQLEPDQIFLTTSTSEAYSFVFRLLANPGDIVMAPQPSYPLFDFLGVLNDLAVEPYPLIYDDGWLVDLESLSTGWKPRCRAVLAVSPNNPTGSYIKEHELARLTEICRSSQAALIADEVFADYACAADPNRVASCAQATDALTFTLSGLSKISALPQMKLAWIVVNGPRPLLDDALARLEVIADTYLSVSAPIALATPQWLDHRRHIQPQILERVQSNLRKLDELLAGDLPVGRLKVEGGWYAVLRVPSTRSDGDWALELLARDGVLVHPGHFYDFPAEGFLVLSLLPAPQDFAEAVQRVIARICARS